MLETLNLSAELQAAVNPLLDALPLERAMDKLVAKLPDAEHRSLVQRIVSDPSVAAKPALVAGLWLYVDDLERSHAVSQSMPDATGSFWHGIMHRREGDFSNSHYWFRQTGEHPAMVAIRGYDAHGFVDQVEKSYRAGHNSDPALIATQRREWIALFNWCAAQ